MWLNLILMRWKSTEIFQTGAKCRNGAVFFPLAELLVHEYADLIYESLCVINIYYNYIP